MAFTSLGSGGTGSLETTATQILPVTVSRTIAVGEIAFLTIAGDADATGTNPLSTMSVSDNAGNTWTRVREAHQRNGALNGVIGGLWWAKITSALSSGQFINITFTNGAPSQKHAAVRTFTVGAGNTVQLADNNPAQAVNHAVATATSAAVTVPSSGSLSTPSLGRVWIALHGSETKVTTGTADADYTHGTALSGTAGSDAVNVRLRWGFRLSTVTSDTYTGQTGATSTDQVVILAAFDEVSAGPSDQTITPNGLSSYEACGRPTAVPHDRIHVGHLDAGGSTADTTVYTTTSVSIAPRSHVFLWVLDEGASDSASITVTGCNLTWEYDSATTIATGHYARLFIGWGASPTYDYITLTYGTMRTRIVWSLDQITGIFYRSDLYDGYWDNFFTSGTGSLTDTLNDPTWQPPASLSLAWYTLNALTAITPEWTALTTLTGTSTQLVPSWQWSGTDDTVTYTTASSAASTLHAIIWVPEGIIPDGLPSAFAAGTATLTPGAVAVEPGGIAAAFAAGTASLSVAAAPSPAARQWLVPGEHYVNAASQQREWLTSAYLSEEPSALATLSPIGIASSEACGGHRIALGALAPHREYMVVGGLDAFLNEGVSRSWLLPGGPLTGAPTGAGAPADLVLEPSGIASGFASGSPAAPAASHLTSGGSGGTMGVTAYTTASISPSGDALLLAWVASRDLLSGNASVPTVTGNGLTWVQVATQIFSGADRRLTLFRAMGAAPTPGIVTFTFGNQQWACVWSVAEFTHVETGGTAGADAIGQSATNQGSGSSLTVTLAALTSGNVGAAGFGGYVGSLLDPGSGWTLLGRALDLTPLSVMSEWNATGDATADATFGGSGDLTGIAAEIKAGAAGHTVTISPPAALAIEPSGIASAFAAGTASIGTAALQTLAPAGIASGFTAGTASIQNAPLKTIAPAGIASAFAAGGHTLTAPIPSQTITPGGIASGFATGTGSSPTASALTSGYDINFVTGHTTASITPTGPVLLWVQNTRFSPATPTVSGCGLTWTQIATRTFDTVAAPGSRLTAFLGTGTPTTGALTITISPAPFATSWVVVNVTGAATTPLVQSKTNAVDGGSVNAWAVTLDTAPTANNAIVSGNVIVTSAPAGGVLSPEAGWTELAEAGHPDPGVRIQAQWTLASDQSAGVSVASGTPPWAGIAVELAGSFSGHTLTTEAFVRPGGIASAQALGTHHLTPISLVLPAGIASAASLGTHAVTPVLSPPGIPSGEGTGSPWLIQPVPISETIYPGGIPSAQGLGPHILRITTTGPCGGLDIINDAGDLLTLGVGHCPSCVPQPFFPTLAAESERRAIRVPAQANVIDFLVNDAGADMVLTSTLGELLAIVTTGWILSKHDASLFGHYLGWSLRGRDAPFRVETVELEVAAMRVWDTTP